MARASMHSFDCQIYVAPRGTMAFSLPRESGPRRIATFVPIDYDALIDPGFRNLLAAFNSVPQPLQLVQV